MGIDKVKLYPTYLKSQERAAKLREEAVRKHLDLPMEDDVNINQHGITGKHLVALAGIVLLGLLGWRVIEPGEALPPVLPSPAVQEYEVRFWLEDGTELEVQPFAAMEPE